jgi:hypothetical protein
MDFRCAASNRRDRGQFRERNAKVGEPKGGLSLYSSVSEGFVGTLGYHGKK